MLDFPDRSDSVKHLDFHLLFESDAFNLYNNF